MPSLHLIFLALSGGAGATLRYGAEELMCARWPHARRVAISVVNVTGCAAAGLLATHGTKWFGPHVALVSVGFLGGYTTFSGAAALPYLDFRHGHPRRATAGVIVTAALAIIAFALTS